MGQPYPGLLTVKGKNYDPIRCWASGKAEATILAEIPQYIQQILKRSFCSHRSDVQSASHKRGGPTQYNRA